MLLQWHARWWAWTCGKYLQRGGQLVTPADYRFDTFTPFAIDNGAFAYHAAKQPFDWPGYWAMLDTIRAMGVRPMFVAVPDVPFDSVATRALWDEHADRVAGYGWPIAFVVQNGCNPMLRDATPCNADWIFVGGDDAYKWTSMPKWCRGARPVHVGRVNSVDGLLKCERAGATSADGTVWCRKGVTGDRIKALESWLDGSAGRQADSQDVLL